MSFLTGVSLDFYIFLTTYKHSEKFITYILDEAVHSQTTRQRDDQADRKQTFHWTTTSQAGPRNQVDNNFFGRGCFNPNLSTIASSPNFWDNS